MGSTSFDTYVYIYIEGEGSFRKILTEGSEHTISPLTESVACASNRSLKPVAFPVVLVKVGSMLESTIIVGTQLNMKGWNQNVKGACPPPNRSWECLFGSSKGFAQRMLHYTFSKKARDFTAFLQAALYLQQKSAEAH